MTDLILPPVITGIGLIHTADETNVVDSGNLLREQGYLSHSDITEALSAYFPKSRLRRLPLYTRYGLYAAVSALFDAKSFPCPEDTGIVIGSFFGCQKTSFDFMDSILNDGPRLSSPLAFSHAVNNMAAGLLSIMFNTKGPTFTINNQELSFAGALQVGISLLRNNRCAHVLVGVLDEADSRLQEVFPALPMLAGSVFLFLERREQGITAEVMWNPEKQLSPILLYSSERVCPLSIGSLRNTTLAQAFGCILALKNIKTNADTANIFQESPHTSCSATIRLEKLS